MWAGTVTPVMAAVIGPLLRCVLPSTYFSFMSCLWLREEEERLMTRQFCSTPADQDKLGANTASEHYRCYIDAVLQQLKVCSQQISVLHYCRSGHVAGIHSQ